MGSFIDLSGKTFGDLTVIERDLSKKAREVYWICQCSCGKVISTRGTSLRSGKSTSCGCKRIKTIKNLLTEDLSGQIFGKLKVLYLDEENSCHGARWFCECECGTIKSIMAASLKAGRTKSCGCQTSKIISEANSPILPNQRYGKWQVIKKDDEHHLGQGAYWICQCDCGTTKSVKAANLRNGSSLSCGCLSSSGEWIISNLLSQLNYNYQTQFSFDDLIGDVYPLRFDFAVFDNQNNLIALIEYQGEQHYINREFFDKKLKFEKRQEYDQRKRDYCQQKGIKLIEIPYWDFKKIDENYLISCLNDKSKFLGA